MSGEAKAYAAFLERKRRAVPDHGLRETGALNPQLFSFQRACVLWALRKGRAALFLSTGSGKSFCQLEWSKHIQAATGKPVLILAPLAVAPQTVREGERFGVPVRQVKRASDITEDDRIVICNYERLDALDASVFSGIVLDESGCLKSYDGKVRTQIIEAFRRTPYKLACSATPAPNDHMELGNHAEFLGVMSRTEMLSEFFVHDSGKTTDWRLKGHAVDSFWKWVCGWAIVMRRPSDLGFDDTSHVLPALHMREHVIEGSLEMARKAGMLFAVEARTLSERRDARRASIDERVAKAAALVAAVPDRPWLLWGNLNAETDALTKAIPGAVQVTGSDDPEIKAERLLDFAEGRTRVLVSKPEIAGSGLNFQVCADMVFVGLSDSFEQMYQSVRRCWRYGQTREVNVHIVIGEAEGAVLRNIKRKERDHEIMLDGVTAAMRQTQIENVKATSKQTNDYAPKKAMAVPRWLVSEAS